jgi:hypothetical protein
VRGCRSIDREEFVRFFCGADATSSLSHGQISDHLSEPKFLASTVTDPFAGGANGARRGRNKHAPGGGGGVSNQSSVSSQHGGEPVESLTGHHKPVAWSAAVVSSAGLKQRQAEAKARRLTAAELLAQRRERARSRAQGSVWTPIARPGSAAADGRRHKHGHDTCADKWATMSSGHSLHGRTASDRATRPLSASCGPGRQSRLLGAANTRSYSPSPVRWGHQAGPD